MATVVGLASGSLSGNEFLAPPDAAKFAVTDPAEVDADYAYQGEYAGSVFEPRRGWIWTGLQVIARGDGKFEAVQYRGGLPGAGWDRQTKRMLAGELHDNRSGAERRGRRLDDHRRPIRIRLQQRWPAEGNFDQAASRQSDAERRSAANALVLFDGTSADQFNGAKLAADGLLDVGGVTKIPVHDFRLHLEFRLPYMP